MKRFVQAAAVAAVLVIAPSQAFAGAVIGGFNAGTLPAVDDSSYGAYGLGFTANYFGTSYSSAFISTNGYLTFGSGQGTYTPVGLGAGYSGVPIIAGFYADIDTRRGGQTTYGTGLFGGRDAFGVTYNEVGYYNEAGATTDNRNTFQILLVDRNDTGSGNFDIVLNYDKILWEAGTSNGGSQATGRGGDTASVGYNAGQGGGAGTYFEFAGSRVDGALLDGGANSLAAGSNVGTAGRYVFNVRNGVVAPPPTGAVPEPATWSMMIMGFGVAGGALRRSRKVKTTVRFA